MIKDTFKGSLLGQYMHIKYIHTATFMNVLNDKASTNVLWPPMVEDCCLCVKTAVA